MNKQNLIKKAHQKFIESIENIHFNRYDAYNNTDNILFEGIFNNLKLTNMETKDKIIAWAKDRNLIHSDNINRQALKLTEEVGELASAIIKNKREEQIDAIGDIQVVLIILCEMLGINYNDALDSAYNVIKDRKGKMINGSFIKE